MVGAEWKQAVTSDRLAAGPKWCWLWPNGRWRQEPAPDQTLLGTVQNLILTKLKLTRLSVILGRVFIWARLFFTVNLWEKANKNTPTSPVSGGSNSEVCLDWNWTENDVSLYVFDASVSGVEELHCLILSEASQSDREGARGWPVVDLALVN